ncbi:6-phosphofructokinase [bacterium]|nr:6-phosphofructokinase [bacterium]MBU1072533.1 6-phosphofructokinase [bacterium]
MNRKKKIAILTGGGDVPGLNACIKQVVWRALQAGYEVLGLRKGWESLAAYKLGDPEWNAPWLKPLPWEAVRTIDRSGGTFLHSSRTNPAKIREKDMFDHVKRAGMTYPADITDHIFAALEDLQVDALIPVGGDDTLSYAARLHETGFPIMAVPKTMDNDVFGTDYCIGFSTAVTRSVDAITQLRTPIGSHERIGIIELFGRNSGETALIVSYLAGVNRSIISEVPFDMERLAGMLKTDKAGNPSNYAIMTISEGATEVGGEIHQSGEKDAFGHKKLGGIGKHTSHRIKELTGEDIMYQSLAYLMRCGAPDALDRMVAMNYANLAMDYLIEGKTGFMTGLQGGKYTAVPLASITGGIKRVDVDRFYDTDQYRADVRNVSGMPMFLT